MAPIRSNGSPQCESCGKIHDGPLAEAQMLGWGYWSGQTGGGSHHEHVICKDCRTVSYKRAPKKPQGFEDEPMF